MKAEDLRIGNYIYGTSDRKVVVISLGVNFLTTGLGPFELQATEQYSDVHGIKLTPDLLEKCGFKLDSIGWQYIELKKAHKHLVIPFDEGNEVRIEMPYRNVVMTIATGIVYLHQLQNLYFALTHEELKIEL